MGLRAYGPQLLPVCAEAVSKESRHRPSNKLHCFHPGPAVTKELIFSSNIGQHDLDTKSKQVQQWIEKKYHVQVTIKKGKNADQPGNEPDEIFNQILQTMPGIATFSSRPKAIKGGTASTCAFRPLSKKEEKAYRDSQEAERSKDNRNTESEVLCH